MRIRSAATRSKRENGALRRGGKLREESIGQPIVICDVAGMI
jgi:hypothetical protein